MTKNVNPTSRTYGKSISVTRRKVVKGDHVPGSPPSADLVARFKAKLQKSDDK